MTKIIGWKGFDKDFKCRDFQFEVGQEYMEKEAVICEKGFHFCENPLDVFKYYRPSDSRFAFVEGSGKTAKHDDDSKIACANLKIEAEIGLKGLIEAGMKFVFEKIKWGKEDTSQAHGDSSAAQAHGDSSAAQTHGYSSAASVYGPQSIACSTGIRGKAKGKKTCWLALAEWQQNRKNNSWIIRSVQSVKVDGIKIREDVFYALKNGKFVEVE